MKSASSFSKYNILKALLFLLFLGIVGCTGIYLRNVKQDTAQLLASDNSTVPTYHTKPTPASSNAMSQLPTGWVRYLGDGFSFGYPEVYGAFTAGPTNSSSIFSTNASSSLFPGLSTDGRFTLEKIDVNTPIRSKKYGPMIQLNGTTWVATENYPSELKSYEVGDTYNDVQTDTTNTPPTYLFKSGDEGTLQCRLVFKAKEHLYLLTLPEFDTGSYGPSQILNDQKSYDQLAQQIIKSIDFD